MTKTDDKRLDQWAVYNYCISFIDLLGQRDALRRQGLLPVFKTGEDRQRFIGTLKKSIGPIIKLQENTDEMLHKIQENPLESPYRASLSPEQKTVWDEMRRTRVTTQRWSDGLVSFVCLGDNSIKCPLNGIFNIFFSAGSLCFMGLAARCPLRGAIDVAWGTEIHPGELHGAVVASAYELESMYAQYPRIVVGGRTIGLFEAHRSNAEHDVYSQNNKALAELCLGMLAQDADGFWILHYLGKGFRDASDRQLDNIYPIAREFVEEQLRIHQKTGNSKLAFRYGHLLSYFDAHQPSTGMQSRKARDSKEKAHP